MKKIITLLLIVICASLAAGSYGALHDMITYRISPEYYTYYKFIEFGLTESYDQKVSNPLLFAAASGFLATWWIGGIIGLIIGGLVLAFSDSTNKQIIIISSINTAIIFAASSCCGLIGWLWGIYLSGADEALYIHDVLLQADEVKCMTMVSYIHSFGYIGSAIGFVIAIMKTVTLKKE